MTFGSGIVYLLCRFERKLVLLFVMGRKGKRVHEQSVGSSAPSHDYETIKIVSTQKQESTVTESTASSGIPAPPGLDPPVSKAAPTRPFNKSVNTVPFLAAAVMLCMYFIDVNNMSIGNALARAYPD